MERQKEILLVLCSRTWADLCDQSWPTRPPGQPMGMTVCRVPTGTQAAILAAENWRYDFQLFSRHRCELGQDVCPHGQVLPPMERL